MAYEAPWIRAWRDFLGDAKVLQLTLAEEGAWWRLLLLANSKGVVLGTAEQIAPLLRMDQAATCAFIEKLVELKMVKRDETRNNGHFSISKWKERQYFSDYSTPRVQRFRERLKRSETLQVKRSETEKTRGRPEVDQRRQEKKNTNTRTAQAPASFKKPSLEDVKTAIGLHPKWGNVDAEEFWHYWNSRGWRRGGELMRSWEDTLAQRSRQISTRDGDQVTEDTEDLIKRARRKYDERHPEQHGSSPAGSEVSTHLTDAEPGRRVD